MKWRRQWHPTPVLLPGKSHGWRSLVGCSPWGGKESDMTEWLHFHFSLSCIGEGNGNPLQCSCLENPRDRGAWWAAIYGVTQSWTWLKWLSSSSSTYEKEGFPGGASDKETNYQCRRQETWSLSWKHPLEEGMATPSSILAWRIPLIEKPGGLRSLGSQRVRHEWSNLTHMHIY